jgi:D-amino-acid oxidase
MSEAVVLGAGIAGLWTAAVLVDRGHRVVVRTAAAPERTYSAAAACVITPLLPWDPTHPKFLEAWGWYRRTISKFRQIDAAMDLGSKFLELMPSYECGFESGGVRYLEKGFSTSRFQHLPFTQLDEIELNPPVTVRNHVGDYHQCTFSASFNADYCNTEVFLDWLYRYLLSRGVSFVLSPVRSLKELLSLEQGLVFNCLGIDSATIFPDSSLYAVRGQSMFVDDPSPQPPYFGVASGHHAVFKHRRGYYIGSYFIEDESRDRSLPSRVEYELSLEFAQSSYGELCERLGLVARAPDLNRIRRVNTGLRPYRPEGPRIEVDEPLLAFGSGSKRIVHHYGHGAHGWTIGYATAEDCVNLAEVRGWLPYVRRH